MATSGHFIVLEGTDGSGISTQTALLRDALQAQSIPCWATKEPTAGPVGSLLRLALSHRLGMPTTDGQMAPLAPAAMALLFAADRVDHCATDIEPRLRQGTHVLCDRYVLSSLAYQSLDADASWIQQINERALPPSLTIFLDVPPSMCADRIARRGDARELYERVETLRAVRQHYLLLLESSRIAAVRGETHIIDGTGSVANVHGVVLATVRAFLA